MERNMRKRRNQIRVVIQLALVLAGSGFVPRITASPEWDHSKPGDGLFLIDFNSSGHATAVHIVKSTGNAKLDATTVGKLKRWTCQPGVYKQVYVPFAQTRQSGH